jgi:hypothetical protein
VTQIACFVARQIQSKAITEAPRDPSAPVGFSPNRCRHGLSIHAGLPKTPSSHGSEGDHFLNQLQLAGKLATITVLLALKSHIGGFNLNPWS